jgi:hypothetical protein
VPDPRLLATTFQASLARYSVGNDVYGPFHRLRNATTQTRADDQKQMDSGVLWGRTPRGGKGPTAQAYVGALPAGASGVEFMTSIKPHQLGLPAGFGANWYYDDTAFTGLLNQDDAQFAVITIVVTRDVP